MVVDAHIARCLRQQFALQPCIVITRIGDETYNVSKTLLSHHSPYFRAMFERQFKEAEEQAVELGEIPGVVSNRSFELLLQWL